MSNRKILFIMNPNAGKIKSQNQNHEIEQLISKHFDENSYKIVISNSPEMAKTLVKIGLDEKYDSIIAIGGDGTIHAIAQNLISKPKIALGIIPLGSGNDLTKNFNINNLTTEQALEVIKNNRRKQIDILKINDWFLINSMGLGFDAQVAKDYKKIVRISGFSKYVVAVLKNLFRFEQISVDIEYEKEKFTQKVFLCEICNGISAGGGFYLTPNAIIDDGFLDVCIIGDEQVSIIDRIPLLLKVLLKKHPNDRRTNIFRTKKIKLSSPKLDLVHCDGELYDILDGEINVEILEKSLNVIVP